MTDLEQEFLQAGFIVGLQGGELESVCLVLCPAHDGRFDGNRPALAGDLKDQAVLFADLERHVARKPAAAERKIDKGPFAFSIFLELNGDHEAFKRKERTGRSENPRMLSEFDDSPGWWVRCAHRGD